MIKLSPYAKMFYLEWVLNPNSGRYNITIIDELCGDLDVDRLKQAVQRYIQEHLVLHSHIKNVNGELHWFPNNVVKGLEYCEEPATDEELLPYINRLFDLHEDQLCRFKLIRMRSGVHRFVLVFHHIVMDGLSVKSGISDELSNYYNDEYYVTAYSIHQQLEKLSALTNFFDKRLSEEKDQHQAFWAQQLKDIDAVDLSFLKDDKKQYQQTCLARYSLTKKIQFTLNQSILNRLDQLKRQYSISPYYFGFCVFAILLHRYTGNKKFAIPYPFGVKKGIDFIYGAHVNTTLMPFEFCSDTRVLDLFNQIKDFITLSKNGVVNYTEFPTIELFNEHNKHLLQVVFNQTNFRTKTFRFDGVLQKSLHDKFNMYLTNVLAFDQEEIDHVLHYQVSYDNMQMDESLVLTFVDNFKRLFVEILDDLEDGMVNKPIQAYSLLMPNTHQDIVQQVNATKKSFPEAKTICALFEEQVQKNPNNCALVFEDTQLSYKQLDQKAHQLAALIQKKYQCQTNDLVLLCMDRSHHMVIAILAVLKAGCAYVPVAPDLPKKAIFHILKETKAKLILTNELYEEKLTRFVEEGNNRANDSQHLLLIDSLRIQPLMEDCQYRTPIDQCSTDLAYVLYTSGSTGMPKGVMMEHQACVNRIVDMVNVSQITSKDTILFKTNYIFDVSFSDIFAGLFAGACVVITKNVFDMTEITHHLNANAITVVHFTPSQFDIIKNIKGPQLFQSLRVIHFSGEALNSTLLNDIDENIRCINYYGPTEAGEVSAEVMSRDLSNRVTIGFPMANVQLHILDEQLNLVPPGVVGELFIGGIALARGYLNQPQLTHEKFIQNPFQTPNERSNNENGRLYRTGDLARRLLNGNIEYKGRNDFQVKIRGYRIELGEIENQLRAFSGIKQVVVLVKEKEQRKNSVIQEKYLIAYYVSDLPLDTVSMHHYLAERLPEYMLPDVFYQLDALPLGVNGKLNLSVLPVPDLLNDDAYRPPRNVLEEKICASYAEVLGLSEKKIGINDDFFQLGGNSILAIRLIYKLEHYLEIKIADIFKLRTPARIIESSQAAKCTIQQKIDNVVQYYLKSNYSSRDLTVEGKDGAIVEKQARYLQDIKNLKINKNVKKLQNVLLTGATGHLGCHILDKLLSETNYKVYLLVRASSEEVAFNRVAHKFHFYFDLKLEDYKDRLEILAADIQQRDFGLKNAQFSLLVDQIDSVIHCAALVKHYGEYDEFYQANVQTTINLLEFTRIMRGNDFNYISTVGVVIDGYVPQQDYHLSHEDDSAEDFVHGKHFYLQTKYKSELLVSKYRSYGVNGSIYRVGKLGMHSVNYRVQENIDENLCFSHIKTMIHFGMIPEEMSLAEISPVDSTAAAIVKLFDKSELSNCTHHIFNPNMCNVVELFSHYASLNLSKCKLNEFIKAVLDNMQTELMNNNAHLFMLYHLWRQECDEIHSTRMRIAHDKTEAILGELGFHWPPITSEMLIDFVKNATLR